MIKRGDKAWEILFEKFNILEEIEKQGYFEISSAQINGVRESRLMAKFDHLVNLPLIFQNNQLSILPISRSKYVIGHFDAYHKIIFTSNVETLAVDFREDIESIDYANLYSENAALNCAFILGIIENLIGEEVLPTISGRMSTEEFSFRIRSSVNDSIFHNIKVENSQCEIDGGFESQNYLVLIEAKNYFVQDFLIRQIYYPYRRWASKISKKVIPVLMTYSNDRFSFFVYKFEEDLNYNSISLVKQKNYAIAPEKIQTDDILPILETINFIAEPNDIPFPQADIFERIVDLLSLLVTKNLTKEEITENYQFDIRQTNYYTDAGRYLGLIDKFQDLITHEITFKLSDEGRKIFRKRHKLKILELVRKILEHQIFYQSFKLSQDGLVPSKEKIVEIILQSNLQLKNTTPGRRAQTVRRWVEWIWDQIE